MIKHVTLPMQRLTREAFARFGDVIETQGAYSFPINGGTTQRFHDLARIDVFAQGGRPLLNVFRGNPVTLPAVIREVERHPLGSQAFVPLNQTPFIIVVAERGADGLPGDALGFLSDGRQGVNYQPGVWHHPLLALNQVSDFLVIDRGGEGDNCEVVALGRSYLIEAISLS